MIIKLKTQHGHRLPGSEWHVEEIVPHGGHSDAARQYRIDEDCYVLDFNAQIVGESSSKTPN